MRGLGGRTSFLWCLCIAKSMHLRVLETLKTSSRPQKDILVTSRIQRSCLHAPTKRNCVVMLKVLVCALHLQISGFVTWRWESVSDCLISYNDEQKSCANEFQIIKNRMKYVHTPPILESHRGNYESVKMKSKPLAIVVVHSNSLTTHVIASSVFPPKSAYINFD